VHAEDGRGGWHRLIVHVATDGPARQRTRQDNRKVLLELAETQAMEITLE
jgi:hypothetical protein